MAGCHGTGAGRPRRRRIAGNGGGAHLPWTAVAAEGRDRQSGRAALEYAVKASELAPGNPAINWLRLRLCTNAPGCGIREAATTMRWVDADNGAAWLPTLAAAQRERDTTELDRVLGDMAEGTRFDLYADRAAVLIFDVLKRAHGALPAHYLDSDAARLTEAIGVANAAVVPSFSPLINACREAVSTERAEACLTLSKVMQHADAVMAQLVGFAIEKRLTPTDPKELRTIADRRRVLEWRVAAANQSDSSVLPWVKNARARSRLAKCAHGRAKKMSASPYCASTECRWNRRRNTHDRFVLLADTQWPQGRDVSGGDRDPPTRSCR